MKASNMMKLVGTVVIGLVLAGTAQAIPITTLSFADTDVIGQASYRGGGDPTVEAAMINQLLDMSLGLVLNNSPIPDPSKPTNYRRSMNYFGPLADADASTAVPVSYSQSGSYVTFDVGPLGYEYLFAKYDGQNDWSLAWHIEGLTGVLAIPKDGPLNHGISHAYLYNPTPTPTPDGAMTVSLLGMALAGLGMVARRLS